MLLVAGLLAGLLRLRRSTVRQRTGPLLRRSQPFSTTVSVPTTAGKCDEKPTHIRLGARSLERINAREEFSWTASANYIAPEAFTQCNYNYTIRPHAEPLRSYVGDRGGFANIPLIFCNQRGGSFTVYRKLHIN